MATNNNLEIELIHNDQNTFRMRIKAFFSQLFKKSKDSNSDYMNMTKSQLDDLSTDYDLRSFSEKGRYQAVFGKFNSIDIKNAKDIESLEHVNQLGKALTSDSKGDRKKKNGFFKKISEPLNELNQLDKDSKEYDEKRTQLINNIESYLQSHNPRTTIGKARCEFAERLRFILEDEASRKFDDGIYGEEDKEDEENKDLEIDDESFDEELNTSVKEKVSLDNLLEDSKQIRKSKTISQSSEKSDFEL